MNGPPGPRPRRPAVGGQKQRGPAPAGEETALAPVWSPRPPAAPPLKQGPPSPPPAPVNRRPFGEVGRAPVTPWYQRPIRTAPPAIPLRSGSSTANQDQAATAARKRFIRQLLIGAGLLLVLVEAAVLLRGVSALGFTGGKVLDVTKVQAGVLQTLSDPASGYGANTVTDVSCNHGHNPRAEKGATFMCDVTVNGATRHVTVVVSDDDGTYEIDRPR